MVPDGMFSRSRDPYKFWIITDDILEMVQNRDSYNARLIGNHVAFRMEPIPITLSDFEGHYSSLKPFYAPFVWKGDVAHINYGMFTHESEVFGL